MSSMIAPGRRRIKQGAVSERDFQRHAKVPLGGGQVRQGIHDHMDITDRVKASDRHNSHIVRVFVPCAEAGPDPGGVLICYDAARQRAVTHTRLGGELSLLHGLRRLRQECTLVAVGINALELDLSACNQVVSCALIQRPGNRRDVFLRKCIDKRPTPAPRHDKYPRLPFQPAQGIAKFEAEQLDQRGTLLLHRRSAVYVPGDVDQHHRQIAHHDSGNQQPRAQREPSAKHYRGTINSGCRGVPELNGKYSGVVSNAMAGT